MRKLTPGQARYVHHRLAGDKPQVAYAKAFPGASKSAMSSKPYLLEKNPRVIEAMGAAVSGDGKKLARLAPDKQVKELIREAGGEQRMIAEVGLSRAEKRRILRRLAMNPKLDPVDRIRAIQVDNLMTGDNKPVRFEGEITLHGIFQALKGTTGLPAPDEVIELGDGEVTMDPNGPMAALP